jgi:hypothetical protein
VKDPNSEGDRFRLAGWVPGSACRVPLLAGAVQLFDSSRTEFPCELREMIERIVGVETQKRSDGHNIRAIIRDLGMIGESAGIMTVFRAGEAIEIFTNFKMDVGDHAIGNYRQLVADHQDALNSLFVK